MRDPQVRSCERRGGATCRAYSTRSPADGKAGAEVGAAVPPDPEVVAKAKRRRFTADYKQQILTKADAAAEHGGIGALLRREGLYSSHLTKWRVRRQLLFPPRVLIVAGQWRRERAASIQQGLEPRKRGPKSKRNPLAEENQKLQRANERLTEQLA
jgi:transposase